MARPLRRVQPGLRPRHFVRPQDRRQRRRDPDEPAADGHLVLSGTLTPVPPDHVAAVVTYLEMTERPRPKPVPGSPLRLVKWPKPEPAKYRMLFERIGGRWLWFSRLAMDDAVL